MAPKKKGSDVQIARGRLKGALQDVVSVPEQEEETTETNVPTRGRPPKRPKLAPPTPLTHNTFIMKLFDRSVDLAKYNENTALYPICRAWMLNMPRSNKIPNFTNKPPYIPEQRKPMPKFIDDIKSGIITEITELPECNKADESIKRVPSPLPFQKDSSKDKIDLEYDIDNAPVTREILLGDLKHRGVQVRKKWQKHTKVYNESKYSQTFDVLKLIYKQ